MLSDHSRQVLTFLQLLLSYLCVFRRGFHFTTGFRKLRKRGRMSVIVKVGLWKKTPWDEESDWLREGGRTTGQGDRGEGNKRRRTIRSLMRPFWVAYVGHRMNKQTFTTLDWWFTHTEPGCVVYVPHFAIYTQHFTYHSPTGTHIKTEPHCLAFIVYAFPFHSFMDVAPVCPLF